MTCSGLQPGPATGDHTGQLQMHEVHRVSPAWNPQWAADLCNGTAATDEVWVVSIDVGVLAVHEVSNHTLCWLCATVHIFLNSLHQACLLHWIMLKTTRAFSELIWQQ